MVMRDANGVREVGTRISWNHASNILRKRDVPSAEECRKVVLA